MPDNLKERPKNNYIDDEAIKVHSLAGAFKYLVMELKCSVQPFCHHYHVVDNKIHFTVLAVFSAH